MCYKLGIVSEYSAPVLETLRRSGLDPGTFLILGGAAMAMREIRPAQDVDLLLEPTTFKNISSTLLTPGGIPLVQDFEKIDQVEEYRLVSTEKTNGDFLPLDLSSPTKYQRIGAVAFRYWMKRAEELETSLGVQRVMRLEDILSGKVNSSRPKDRQDAIEIQRHLMLAQ